MSDPVCGCFLKCLNVCAEWYDDAIQYNHGGLQKEQREYLLRLRAAIGGLSSLLNDEQVAPNLRGFLPVLAPFENLRSQLSEFDTKLMRVAELRSDSKPRTGLESDFVDALIYQDHFKERSPFEWLAGVYLPEVYYLFFGFESGWGKGAKYLSFVDVVLRSLKVKAEDRTSYSRETISRAVRVRADGNIRRKKGPLVDSDVPDQMEWYRHMHFMDAIRVELGLGLEMRLKSSLEHARRVLADFSAAK
ncbi:hypothetical protein [Bradyrhizobium liaoningense]|uniref:hypothetical protein n=1 Tax=Bradyrhizobium liaoningense TaxID=43992 RepID=UPI001BAB2A0A|nr:hypothetical protein [Bradyrhizobium liaoningense]MBR0941564.1 hypothetical protein [Bradyrhizobium liaoningense]